MNEANQILTELQQDPDFWFNADLILEHSKDNNTKFIALKSLEATIQVLLTSYPPTPQNLR